MEVYKKVVYVWHEPKARIAVPHRLIFRPLERDSIPVLVDAVGRVMADSMDRHDQKAVKEKGAKAAAEHFVAEAKDYFDYELAWWQLAYDHEDKLVGFVQPVTFPDCQKEGLEEATIYYIGVLSEQRGRGYAYDLLCKCTRIMQEVGVWRIYCDTDVYNTAMIETFKRVGYQQEGEPKVVEL